MNFSIEKKERERKKEVSVKAVIFNSFGRHGYFRKVLCGVVFEEPLLQMKKAG